MSNPNSLTFSFGPTPEKQPHLTSPFGTPGTASTASHDLTMSSNSKRVPDKETKEFISSPNQVPNLQPIIENHNRDRAKRNTIGIIDNDRTGRTHTKDASTSSKRESNFNTPTRSSPDRRQTLPSSLKPPENRLTNPFDFKQSAQRNSARSSSVKIFAPKTIAEQPDFGFLNSSKPSITNHSKILTTESRQMSVENEDDKLNNSRNNRVASVEVLKKTNPTENDLPINNSLKKNPISEMTFRSPNTQEISKERSSSVSINESVRLSNMLSPSYTEVVTEMSRPGSVLPERDRSGSLKNSIAINPPNLYFDPKIVEENDANGIQNNSPRNHSIYKNYIPRFSSDSTNNPGIRFSSCDTLIRNSEPKAQIGSYIPLSFQNPMEYLISPKSPGTDIHLNLYSQIEKIMDSNQSINQSQGNIYHSKYLSANEGHVRSSSHDFSTKFSQLTNASNLNSMQSPTREIDFDRFLQKTPEITSPSPNIRIQDFLNNNQRLPLSSQPSTPGAHYRSYSQDIQSRYTQPSTTKPLTSSIYLPIRDSGLVNTSSEKSLVTRAPHINHLQDFVQHRGRQAESTYIENPKDIRYETLSQATLSDYQPKIMAPAKKDYLIVRSSAQGTSSTNFGGDVVKIEHMPGENLYRTYDFTNDLNYNKKPRQLLKVGYYKSLVDYAKSKVSKQIIVEEKEAKQALSQVDFLFPLNK